MDPGDTLVGVSEFCLALGGFAAIVLVISGRGEQFNAEILANVRVMLSGAIGSAFFCLIGVVVLALEVSPPGAWVLLSTLALIVTLAVAAVNYLLFLRHLEQSVLRSRRTLLWWSFVVVGCSVHLANAFGVFGSPSFGLFLLGLVIIVGLPGGLFVHTVYALLGGPAAQQGAAD
jgi:hypothetical protein